MIDLTTPEGIAAWTAHCDAAKKRGGGDYRTPDPLSPAALRDSLGACVIDQPQRQAKEEKK